MNEVKATEDKKFYHDLEHIIIKSPIEGIVCANHPDLTIIPRVVKPGENEVLAVRHAKLISVGAGEVVGIVTPIPTDTHTTAATTTPPANTDAKKVESK